MIPNNIEKKHIEQALAEIDKEGVRAGRHSSTYDLVHDGKRYPPKLVISIANRYANGKELDPSTFPGGMGTHCFEILEGFDYKIEQKSTKMSLNEVIEECNLTFNEVKNHYPDIYNSIYEHEKSWLNNLEDKTHRLNNEVREDIDYVISCLKKPEYSFVAQDLKSLSAFTGSINTIIRIANRINNFKQGVVLDGGQTLELIDLFDAIKTTDRLSDLSFNLNKNLNSFIPHLYSVIKHCQSPDQYPIYYKYWRNILREVLKAGDDYNSLCDLYQSIGCSHLEFGAYNGTIGTILASKISENGIIKEEDDKNYKYIRNKILNIHYFDLITSYKRRPNHYLIGSKYGDKNDVDVFPDMLKKDVVSVGFASQLDLSEFYLADQNELIDYLKEEGENQSSINALKHFLSIKVGDFVAVKSSGSPKGKQGFLSVVGICQVVKDENDEVYQYDPEGLGHSLNVKYIYAPIYEEFPFGGYGSTVHKLSKQGHINAIFGEEPLEFRNILSAFDESSLDAYMKALREMLREIGLEHGDQRVVYSIRKDRLNFMVGQRYCFNLYSSNPKGQFGVISIDELGPSSEPFSGKGSQPYYTYYTDFEPNAREWSSIITAVESELNRTSISGFRRHNSNDFENYVFNVDDSSKKEQMEYPLNTILYGPPGTGKTYLTVKRAAEIISERSIEDYDEGLKIFNENLHKRIEFITFHQNYSYEDFIQGLRPNTKTGDQLTFLKEDGVFKKIADRALKNLEEADAAPTELTAAARFKAGLDKLIDEIQDHEDNFPITDAVHIFEVEEDAFRYNGENWTAHPTGIRMKFTDLEEFFKRGVKSRKDIKVLENVSGLAKQHATYYFKIYERIIKLIPSKVTVDKSVQKQNFVIIIDEINRANISRVFGELITLIEPDKRSHGKIPMEAKLPSGDTFVVPSNLYIIGTMNTADKSIALLDIALRRRFEFQPMYPKYTKDGLEVNDENVLKSINKMIVEEKGHDFQIGHSYFMDSPQDAYDFEKRMNVKVIPLLLEYFMNDGKAVSGIVSNAIKETGYQIDANAWPLTITKRND